MQYLYDKLTDYAHSDYYPFHMPGHKRNKGGFMDPYQIDITEIDGFDNLHHPEGILREAQSRAARLYHSDHTYFLVNGSTAGILSAVSACAPIGSKILAARNCHKAVYHSILLRKLEVIYTYPQQDGETGVNCGLDPENIGEMLKNHSDIRAVVITSPTYDGVVSDVGEIAKLCHSYGKPLIVDEAHGAHFGFHPYFPENSIKKGADIVIHSLHKTLPSFTQTAIIHLNSKLVDRERLEMYLGIYQSSSPSYILMSGIDECIRMVEQDGQRLFDAFAANLKLFRERMEGLRHIRLAGEDLMGRAYVSDFDRSKLILYAWDGSMDGRELYEELLNRFHIQLEMAAGGYALALASVGDTREGFERLYEALSQIDRELGERDCHRVDSGTSKRFDKLYENEQVLRIDEAEEGKKRKVLLEKSEGLVSGEFVYLYPPGIPLLVPGEKISGEFLKNVLEYKEKGFSLQGMKDYTAKSIEVTA